MIESCDKIFPEDLPSGTLDVVRMKMEADGWKFTGVSFHQTILHFERRSSKTPAVANKCHSCGREFEDDPGDIHFLSNTVKDTRTLRENLEYNLPR